jgi:3-oxoacyl-[acyl-carrier-protein] synthase I
VGQLTVPLYITGAGAVTAAGLTAPQTCAAIRAGVTGFSMETLSDPFGAEQTVARIPANWRLKRDAGQWLVNLAVRAIREAVQDAAEADPVPMERTALFLTPPEGHRGHPAYEFSAPAAILEAIFAACEMTFHPSSRAVDGGAAAGLGLLAQASALLALGTVDRVILAGVDSLVNPTDLARLAAANRLAGGSNSQGLIPGEGAAAVVLSPRPPEATRPTCAILSVASAREENSVLSEGFSQGRAMLAALREASRKGEMDGEPFVEFVFSNGNGERYATWESMITRARFYRTRRERTPAAMPAMSVGETGSAAAALALVVARDAFAKGYAPGRVAMAEIASDDGLRSAAMLRTTAAAAQLQAG